MNFIDKNAGDPESGKMFLKISEAYKRITDPQSFADEEDGDFEDMSEEQMNAMFMSMFSEMMGGFGFDGDMGEFFVEFDGDEDDDEDDMPEEMLDMMEMMMMGGAMGVDFEGMDEEEVMAMMMMLGMGGGGSMFEIDMPRGGGRRAGRGRPGLGAKPKQGKKKQGKKKKSSAKSSGKSTKSDSSTTSVSAFAEVTCARKLSR